MTYEKAPHWTLPQKNSAQSVCKKNSYGGHRQTHKQKTNQSPKFSCVPVWIAPFGRSNN